jgi:hypothetical protein
MVHLGQSVIDVIIAAGTVWTCHGILPLLLTSYFATKERHHGTETNPGIPRRGSARSVDERLAS